MSSPTIGRPRRTVLGLLAVVLVTLVAGCLPPEEQTFLDRTNSFRSANGVAPLREHATLTKKAEDWARSMAATGTLAHSDLTSGLGGLDWRSLGENVGMSSPTSDTLLTIHNKFVSSSDHRANLLNAGFTHMGVGVHTDARGVVWVAEVFARL